MLAPDALQRKHELREVFNAVRYLVQTGAPWRSLPTNFPPWPAVYQQARRWLAAGCFEALVHDLRLLLRALTGRAPHPTAAILDARVLHSSPESGARAGYNGHQRRKGSKGPAAVDTLGHLLALTVTPASADERTQVAALAEQVQAVTGQSVAVAFVDQGYYRRGGRRDGGGARSPAPGRPSARGQARLRPAAPPLGGGAQLRLDGALPPPRPR